MLDEIEPQELKTTVDSLVERVTSIEKQIMELPETEPRLSVTKGQPTPKCICKVELNKDEPIICTAIGTDSALASFKPNYTQEPTCDPDDVCEKTVTYKWTITPIDGKPIMAKSLPKPKDDKDDQEEATVWRAGTFQLCVKVMVKCRRRINPENPHAFRVSRCEDPGCSDFELA